MPGLIPFLPTPPLPQPTRTASSSSSARTANSFLAPNRGAARGSSSQAPIELDDDPEPPTPPTATAATTTDAFSQPQQITESQTDNLWSWGIPTPDGTQSQRALPSFSDFAANLDLELSNGTGFLIGPSPHTPAREPNSDDFLSALIDGNFSSPSSYPQSTQASSGTRQINQFPKPQNPPSRQISSTSLQPTRPPDSNRPAASTNASPHNTATAPATTARSSRRPTPHPGFLDSEIEESLFVSSDNEPDDNMPVQTRRRASIISSDPELEEVASSNTRKRAATSTTSSRSAKRRRSSQTAAARTPTTPNAPQGVVATKVEEDDVFGDDKDESKGKAKEEKEDVIDLAASNEVPQEMLIPKEDKRIKLSAFQCVICMDDVTALTVTHCGHLFCSECLHSALNVDATKNKCPICRQKVETKDRSDYTSKTKGYWPLELKLMTASRKGKQRA